MCNYTSLIPLLLVSVILFTGGIAAAQSDYFIAASNAPAHVKERADLVCDGLNDQAEINYALNSTGTETGNAFDPCRVLLSSGIFHCGSAVSVQNKSVTLQGQGPGVTKLMFSMGGVHASFTYWRCKVTVRDLSILTSRPGGATGLHIVGPFEQYGGQMDKMVYLNNINIDCRDREQDYWTNGIILKNIYYCLRNHDLI